jgi:pimeloyl-ACP methyl ester carboxylesterase
LPVYGLAPTEEAAAEIVAFVDEVIAATDAADVALVGHSEGAFLSLYVPKVAGLADRVSTVVALAPPTHGTSFFTLVTLGRLTGLYEPIFEPMLRNGGCPGCADLVVGGRAIPRLNDGPIAQPGIDYTVVATRYDALVRNEAYRPATATAFVNEPGVTNLFVQDRCPVDPVGHIGIAVDPTILGIVRHALDPALPLGPCSFGPPL